MPDSSAAEARTPSDEKLNHVFQLVLGGCTAHERNAAVDALIRLIDARGLERKDVQLVDMTKDTFGIMRDRINDLQHTVDKLRRDKLDYLRGRPKPQRKQRRARRSVVLSVEDMECILNAICPDTRKRAAAVAAVLSVSPNTARRQIRNRLFSKAQIDKLDRAAQSARNEAPPEQSEWGWGEHSGDMGATAYGQVA
ncbi:hypothetical protein [Azospirillum soli]|uniref:hypothetical protein n=1 Tax=Azospirillum soli TaxID=1304799 RepID=UPI001AE1CE34|nr:hypothetical protein [Azospirillum soli]MBP2316052.1 hypothetical protein [Azospirillum soli]